MRSRHPLILGTLLLTATGVISRIIGFFYRIFLSRTFGEEGMGIYQLIAPVMVLSFSLTAAGLQTAISKYVASESSNHNYRSSYSYLISGLFVSTLASIVLGSFIYLNSTFIATSILLEERTAPLLQILAISFPFCAIHSCICGYYYGIKHTAIPAASQLLEQSARVASVFLLYYLSLKNGTKITISVAAIGLLLGECVSSLFSIIVIFIKYHKMPLPKAEAPPSLSGCTKTLLIFAAPLTLNRVIINLLQSAEAIYIPNKLQAYGLSVSDALSIYGVLTGMALSIILFPSTLTGSASVLLLPVISEANSRKNKRMIRNTILRTTKYCCLLGVVCTIGFFFLGPTLGVLLFGSEMAGSFIRVLSFICPFLYLSGTFSSILHGLGKTITVFIINILSLSVRLLFVFVGIPLWGIRGYMIGLLISQLLSTALQLLALRTYMVYNEYIFDDSL